MYAGAAAVFGFLLLATANAFWDFNHPRVWESPGNDPHVYAWGLGAAWLVAGYVAVSIARSERRRARRERTARMLGRTEALLREGRLAEAEACLEACKRLSGYRRG